MSLEKALQEAQARIPECLAIGVVDLSSGMLLAVRTVDSHPQETLDMLSAATADMFQGKNVVAIEEMFKKRRGVKDDGQHYFQEIIVNSENLIHIFQRGKKKQDMVMVCVCRVSANLGMVLSQARMSLKSVEAAV